MLSSHLEIGSPLGGHFLDDVCGADVGPGHQTEREGGAAPPGDIEAHQVVAPLAPKLDVEDGTFQSFNWRHIGVIIILEFVHLYPAFPDSRQDIHQL